MKNPNIPPTYLPHSSNILNMELSPLIHLSDNCPKLVKHLQMFPAPTNLRSTALGHPSNNMLPCHASVLHLSASIYCFSPLFSPVDPETDAAAEYDYALDDQPLLAELPGKQNPLDHSYIAYSLSLSCLH